LTLRGKFEIDVEAYAEAEQWALEFLRDDCGHTGLLIVDRFHESDYGASQIVDVTTFSMLDKDAIKVELDNGDDPPLGRTRAHRGGPRSGSLHRKRGVMRQ